MSHRLTLRQLYSQYPQGLVVPYYQRHYVWGQYRLGDTDAVTCLTQCLVEAYRSDTKYFIQGITVSGDHLIDGQQRLTYIYLLLRTLGYRDVPALKYDHRDEAARWLIQEHYTVKENAAEKSQDIYFFKLTVRIIEQIINTAHIDKAKFLEFVLDKVELLFISLTPDINEIAIYKMMNGTKAPMEAPDIIKADILRLATDSSQPNATDWELVGLRMRYADQWNTWTRWWNNDAVRQYYAKVNDRGLGLLLKLCIRRLDSDMTSGVTHNEFRSYLDSLGTELYHAAKHTFEKLRRMQRRFDDSFADPTVYNRIQAIMLLQTPEQVYRFLHLYFVERSIDSRELLRYYKLSFLGMSITDIYNHEPEEERFDDLLASLSMADVYHSDTKRDVFNLLLRLNIDEDTKLGRKFDFSVWGNRSLEHIYSKSKVWHTDKEGHIYDGNDNQLRQSRHDIEADPTFMPRSCIVNYDGSLLSEHCIGNLVLLYGENNASFGNATFEQKKMLFLAPGDMTVFQSRNLLHTVCVFAGNSWDNRSIVDNYNQMLKNLKIYYGFK